MYRLLSILSRYRNFLLWILLQGIALTMIIRTNDHQRLVFGNMMLEVSGRMYKQRAQFTRFIDLPLTNDSLVSRNKHLQQLNDSLVRHIRSIEANILLDTMISPGVASNFETKREYELIQCRALRTTLNKSYNYIYLDKGAKHGIKTNMGVISPQGVAGRVIRVSDNYSVALSALNVSFKLSAKIQGVDHPGLYEWKSGDPYHAYLELIPLDVNLYDKTNIITSSVSTVFPEGYLVGTIESSDMNPQKGTYTIKMRLATNFAKLDNLYIIDALFQNEIDSLSTDLSQD